MYEKSVFINCPFDADYMPMLHAITFAISYAGFIPRSALEASDSGQQRLGKLIEIIRDCRYSVHDISRVETVASDPNNLPRFNMPFECGVFFGARYFGSEAQQTKQLIVLDSEKYRFQKTLSDIAGNDPECHNNSPDEVIACVRRFLNDKTKHSNLPGAEFLQTEYARFRAAMPALVKDLKISMREIEQSAYWKDYANTVEVWLQTFLTMPVTPSTSS